ncbi:hypothetical protein LIER_33039 [Lithospermum erythrorhizon]|uniref:PB1 domain-containing protein n=1 Tax=Lithospermum erythrorhizon TaxID=34254 RepID=A0AAV3RVI4_LITER
MSEVNPQHHLSITGDRNFEGNMSLDDFMKYMPQDLQILKQSENTLGKMMLTYAAFGRVSGVSTLKTRIVSALMQFGKDITPYLIQFWGRESIDGKRYLISSELPFSISNIDRGSSSYRKRCMSYRYSLDGRSIGPAARVFLQGTVEFNHIADYSLDEYSLRDYALTCRAHQILFVPIYEPPGRQCIGVVEYIGFGEIGFFLEDDLRNMWRIFLSEDLMLKDLPYSLIGLVEHTELDMALKHACNSRYIPFAQVWRPCTDWETGTLVFSVIKRKCLKGKSRSYKPFYTKCKSVPLKEWEGTVGKAFSSLTSFFCKLSTDVHPLALDASEVGFIYSFAVCLRHRHISTGYKTFILEFFVSNSAPTSIEALDSVRSVLDTIKRECPNLRQASGQLGDSVDVALHDPASSNSYPPGETTLANVPTDTEFSLNRGEVVPSSFEQPAEMEMPAVFQSENLSLGEGPCFFVEDLLDLSPYPDDAVDVATHDPAINNAYPPGKSTLVKVPNETSGDMFRSSFEQQAVVAPNDPSDMMLSDEPSETNGDTIGSSQEDIVLSEAETMRSDQPSVADAQNIDSMQINIKHIPPLKNAKAVKKFKSPLTFEIIQRHAVGQIELVAKHLKGKRGTKYKATSTSSIQKICRDNKFKDWHELKNKMLSRLHPDYIKAAQEHIQQVGCETEVPGFSPNVIVNALYLDKTKSFEFSIVKDIKELLEKLAKVFKLQANNFQMKYENEDGEWIPLATDEDLSTCFQNVRYFRDTTVYVQVEYISNAPS